MEHDLANHYLLNSKETFKYQMKQCVKRIVMSLLFFIVNCESNFISDSKGSIMKRKLLTKKQNHTTANTEKPFVFYRQQRKKKTAEQQGMINEILI